LYLFLIQLPPRTNLQNLLNLSLSIPILKPILRTLQKQLKKHLSPQINKKFRLRDPRSILRPHKMRRENLHNVTDTQGPLFRGRGVPFSRDVNDVDEKEGEVCEEEDFEDFFGGEEESLFEGGERDLMILDLDVFVDGVIVHRDYCQEQPWNDTSAGHWGGRVLLRRSTLSV
jgi:hypothetical protein